MDLASDRPNLLCPIGGVYGILRVVLGQSVFFSDNVLTFLLVSTGLFVISDLEFNCLHKVLKCSRHLCCSVGVGETLFEEYKCAQRCERIVRSNVTITLVCESL